MRLNDLLGVRVLDRDGTEVGHVVDLAVTESFTEQPRTPCVITVRALLVSRRRVSRLLGYGRASRPALLQRLSRRAEAAVLVVPLDQVVDLEAQPVALRQPASALVAYADL